MLLGIPVATFLLHQSWLNWYFYSKGEKGIYLIFKEGARVVRVKRPLFVQKRSKLAVFPCINGYEIHIQ